MTTSINDTEASSDEEVKAPASSIEESMLREIDMIQQEVELTNEIDDLRQRLAESRKVRRSIPKPTAALEAAWKALKEAQGKVKRLEQEKADAKALLSSLNTRLDAGDEDVTVDQIVAAEKSIERADRLIKPAKASVQKAERAVRPLAADDHLANLAADALEKITDAPVVIHKTVEEAPDFEPLVIVSQTRATEGYGTLECSGEVRLSGKSVEIGLKALRDALEETGSEVSVTRDGIQFTDARWPIPRLSQPS